MNQLISIKGLNKTDMTLYGVSILFGVLIVLANYQLSATQEMAERNGFINDYMEQIISRMDMVSGQLSAWGRMDIRQYQR